MSSDLCIQSAENTYAATDKLSIILSLIFFHHQCNVK